MKHEDILRQLTLKEKAAFVGGADYWTLVDKNALGLPKIMITDGPNGLRKKRSDKKPSDGINLGDCVPATCFPTASSASCSWDEELLRQEGEAIAEECLKERVSVILGPGVNIKRSPVCGRNFEYFSEDPYLAGKCAAALIRGLQAKGVGASLKHFACNSQEAFRMIIDEIVDERALREIYLLPFEIAVKEGKPWTVMNSYNRINGVYSSQNFRLQQTILRDEWGFDGLIVTDWGSSVDRIRGLQCGTDLEMPSSGTLNTKKIVDAVRRGLLPESTLDRCVDRVIDLIMRAKPALAQKHTCDYESHHRLARKIAGNCMVLLKNEDAILPLKKGQRVAVIGDMAIEPRFQGAGTSVVEPTVLCNAYDELAAAGVDMVYAPGYDRKTDRVDEELLADSVRVAKDADVVLLFIGLTELFEAEGYDRSNIDLPENHNRLVFEIAKANPNTVVVLSGGSVVHMPWIHEAKAVLNAGLCGQAGGGAIADILTGAVVPSAKTTETYPLAFSDNPTYGNYPGGPSLSVHRESIYVGYRYYDTAGKDVLFPFGYGLSYTTFVYSDLTLSADLIRETQDVVVSFSISNTGSRDGAEIAQIYVSDPVSTVFRPQKELKAFRKVFLKAGETKSVSITLDRRAFAFFSVEKGQWVVESGTFKIAVGASSRDIRLSAELTVEAEDETSVGPDLRETAPAYYTADIDRMTDRQFEAVYGQKLPSDRADDTGRIDMLCCLNDAKHTKWGAVACSLLTKIMTKMGSSGNGDGKMLAAMATQIPIRNFVAMSMGVFSPGMANGLLKILNDDESTLIGLLQILGGVGGALLRLPRLLRSI